MGAAQLSALKPKFDTKEVRLVGIGLEKEGLGDFIKGRYFENGELYLDEPQAAYKALECRQNTWKNFWGLCGGQIMKYYNKSKKLGYGMNMKGNTPQLGGTFVIAPGGALLYGHYQTATDFEPDLKEILRVLDIDVPADFDPADVPDPSKSRSTSE